MQGSFAVYYDGSCPLCRKEIAFYQRRRGADSISWVDVSDPDAVPSDLDCSEALSRFHVREGNGRIVDGGEAFAALWRQLPAFCLIGHLFRAAPLKWVLNAAYEAFLPIRPRLQALLAKKGVKTSD